LCNPSPNTIHTYSVSPVVGATNYTWTLPSGSTISSGQGTTTITVKWTFAQLHNGVAGLVSCQANNSNACGTSLPSSLPISIQISNPVTPGSISGALKVCPGDPIQTFSIAKVSRANSYGWTMPSGATLISGAGTNIVTVAFDAAFVGGDITVNASNGCGASSARIRSLSLNRLPAPVISGMVNGVCGASNVPYSVAPVSGALSYSWSLPSFSSLNSSSVSGDQIAINLLSGYTSSSLTVNAVNNCGAGITRSITVNGAPVTPGVISGSPTLCFNNIYPFSISTVAGSSAYNWITSGASLAIQANNGLGTGQGLKNIEIRANSLATNQSIAVKASNTCGASRNANYTGISVAVCSRIDPSSQALASGVKLAAYPNPSKDKMWISFESSLEGKANLNIVSVTGQNVYTKEVNLNEGINQFEVELTGISNGMYFLNFSSSTELFDSIRIIKE
jgi:hypothetical protein